MREILIENLKDTELIDAYKERNARPPWGKKGKIKKLIKESDGLIALSTRRKNGVKKEMKLAYTIDLPILLFYEKGIKINERFYNYTDLLGFEREKFYLKVIPLVNYIRNFEETIREKAKERPSKKRILEFKPKMKPIKNYKFKTIERDTAIFKNGHGIISYSTALEVLSEKFSSFSLFFGIDDWTLKQIELRLFETISSMPVSKRYTDQTFWISFKKKMDYSCKCLVDEKNRKEIQITSPKNKFKRGDIIVFSWGWSCPFLYPNSKQAEKLKRGIISTIIPIYPIEKFALNINIESGHSLTKKSFECEGWLHNKRVMNVTLIKEKKLYQQRYQKYKVEIKNLIPKNKYLLTFVQK